MRILLTNNTLAGRAGTELYLCEVVEELLAAGHEPMCFSLHLGEIAERLAKLGVPVSDDLRAFSAEPDVIHGHHFIETTLAAMTFRTVPVISFCHGPEAWQESGCRLPNVVRWVTVDDACRRRLIEDEGIDPSRVITLLNHYDERKYYPRTPLPEKPRKALILSNYLGPEHPAVMAVQAACAARGIELHTAGQLLGGVVENIETLLPQYDLVFAKARCIIEALAVGCAAMQVEYFGSGRLVRSENYNELRRYNFGFRTMNFPLESDYIGSEIDRYDAEDATRISRRIREEATLVKTVSSLIRLYAEAVAMKGSLPDFDPAIATADFLRFHLHLSKIPLSDLRKTAGIPLRLPPSPIPPGHLSTTWRQLCAPHISVTAETIGGLQHQVSLSAEKNAHLQERNVGLEEKFVSLEEMRVSSEERNVHLDERNVGLDERNVRLQERNERLQERIARLQTRTTGEIESLQRKLALLTEKHSALQLRSKKPPAPPRRTFSQKLRRLFGLRS